MSRRVDRLNPKAAAAALRAQKRLDDAGVAHFTDSTLRLLIEQQALHAQGRESLIAVNALRSQAGFYLLTEKENNHTVTNADGIKYKSAHQDGNAIDEVPAENGRPVWPPASDPRWKQIAAAFVAEGFIWGGDWDGDGKTRSDGDLDEVFVDYPHYQYKA
jgi:hypothetical protein